MILAITPLWVAEVSPFHKKLVLLTIHKNVTFYLNVNWPGKNFQSFWDKIRMQKMDCSPYPFVIIVSGDNSKKKTPKRFLAGLGLVRFPC